MHTSCESGYRRVGFTLIELVAALAIVATLMSIMLVGIVKAREVARRADCTNRLRQLVLATHQFEAARQILPQASTNDEGPSELVNGQRASLLHSSGLWRLLPYLGYERLADEVKYVQMQGGGSDTTEQMPRKTRIRLSVFLCPSDPVDEGTNYRFNSGSNPTCFDYAGLPESLRPNGPFGLFLKRLSAIPGGTSGTAAFSERLKAPSGRYDHRAHIWGASLNNTFSPAEIDHRLLRLLANEVGTSEPPTYSRLAGLNWHGGGKLFTLYDHVFTPNPPLPAISAGSSVLHNWEPTGAVPPTSNHPGGVNTAILDGSVRFIADTIDAQVWERLGSVAQTAQVD